MDGKLKYIDVSTGFPGSIHYARVLCASLIYHTVERGEILKRPLAFIKNQPVKSFIIGDGAYPLSRSFLKPYSENGALTRSERKYNKTLSSARSIMERWFGVLKGLQPCVSKKKDPPRKTSQVRCNLKRLPLRKRKCPVQIWLDQRKKIMKASGIDLFQLNRKSVQEEIVDSDGISDGREIFLVNPVADNEGC